MGSTIDALASAAHVVACGRRSVAACPSQASHFREASPFGKLNLSGSLLGSVLKHLTPCRPRFSPSHCSWPASMEATLLNVASRVGSLVEDSRRQIYNLLNLLHNRSTRAGNAPGLQNEGVGRKTDDRESSTSNITLFFATTMPSYCLGDKLHAR